MDGLAAVLFGLASIVVALIAIVEIARSPGKRKIWGGWTLETRKDHCWNFALRTFEDRDQIAKFMRYMKDFGYSGEKFIVMHVTDMVRDAAMARAAADESRRATDALTEINEMQQMLEGMRG